MIDSLNTVLRKLPPWLLYIAGTLPVVWLFYACLLYTSPSPRDRG